MHSSLWELDPTGDARPRRLTRSAPGESAATFARDGSILFTSSRPDPDRAPDEGDDEEVSGLWLLPAAGGEARLLAAPSGGVDAVIAARGADVIVYAASVFRGTSDHAADRERHQARKKAGVEALLFDTFPIRHWDAFHGPRERHRAAAGGRGAHRGPRRPHPAGTVEPRGASLRPHSGRRNRHHRLGDARRDGPPPMSGWWRSTVAPARIAT
jgi:hypothetical protein